MEKLKGMREAGSYKCETTEIVLVVVGYYQAFEVFVEGIWVSLE